jgi:hypothetical protein
LTDPRPFTETQPPGADCAKRSRRKNKALRPEARPLRSFFFRLPETSLSHVGRVLPMLIEVPSNVPQNCVCLRKAQRRVGSGYGRGRPRAERLTRPRLGLRQGDCERRPRAPRILRPSGGRGQATGAHDRCRTPYKKSMPAYRESSTRPALPAQC